LKQKLKVVCLGWCSAGGRVVARAVGLGDARGACTHANGPVRAAARAVAAQSEMHKQKEERPSQASAAAAARGMSAPLGRTPPQVNRKKNHPRYPTPFRIPPSLYLAFCSSSRHQIALARALNFLLYAGQFISYPPSPFSTLAVTRFFTGHFKVDLCFKVEISSLIKWCAN
jgi:hypothetical protein